ncbi:MAG: hypothetical protein RLZZ618_2152 [Pseudomonadota bacterium]|jgi:hypothetical protein
MGHAMTPMLSCKHCTKVVLHFTPTDDALQSVVRALSNGSKGLAAGEFKYFSNCSDEEAAAWVEHLLQCAHAWPNAQADQNVLTLIDSAFADVVKPEHFTDYTHCDECNEHDTMLRARTRDSLRRSDLGNPGWDPITFSRAEGIGYFFPVLARFALLPDVWRDNEWYAGQFLSHIAWDGRENRFLLWCTPQQRIVVHAFLTHFSATRGNAALSCAIQDDLQAGLAAWQPSTR